MKEDREALYSFIYEDKKYYFDISGYPTTWRYLQLPDGTLLEVKNRRFVLVTREVYEKDCRCATLMQK